MGLYIAEYERTVELSNRAGTPHSTPYPVNGGIPGPGELHCYCLRAGG